MKFKTLWFWTVIFVFIFPIFVRASVVSTIATGKPLKAEPMSCVSIQPALGSGPGAYYFTANFVISTSHCNEQELSQLRAGMVFTLDLTKTSSSIQALFATNNDAVQFNTLSPWAQWPAVFIPSSDVYTSNNSFTLAAMLPYTVPSGQQIVLGFNVNNLTPAQINSIISSFSSDVVTVYALQNFVVSATITDGEVPTNFSTAAYPVTYPTLTLEWCSNGYNVQDNTCATGRWITAGIGDFTQWSQNWSAYGLPYGVYRLSGNTLSFDNGAVFSPVQTQPFVISPLAQNSARVAYIQTHDADGSVNIVMPSQPAGTQVPSLVVAKLLDSDTDEVLSSVSLPWGATTAVTNLAPEKTFILQFDPFFYINADNSGLKKETLTPSSSSFTPGTSTVPTVTVTSQSSDVSSWTANFSATTTPSVPASVKGNVVVSGVLDSTPVTLSEQINLDGTQSSVIVPGSASANYSVSNIAYNTNNVQGYLIPNVTHGSLQPPSSSQLIKYQYFAIPQVTGWPTGHIAMGNLTGDGGVTSEGLTARQAAIDALFKYAGSNGAGDRGQVWPPIWTHLTVEEAKDLSQSKGESVIPVMVEYTAQMSGGTSYDDINSQETVAMHFTNLAFDANDMAYSIQHENLNGGSMVLNPDLFGMIAQNSLQSTIDASFQNNPINIQQAVASACCMVAKYSEPSIRDLTGQITDYGTCFQANQPTTCAVPALGETVSIPSFASGAGGTSTFADWIAANNWIARNFGGTHVSFGWMLNIWSADNKQDPSLPPASYACATASATWLHFAKNSSDVQNCYSNLNLNVLQYYHVYDGKSAGTYQPSSNPVPDYVAFDKYEMDVVPGAVGIGYLFNDRDWENYFTAIQYVSKGLSVGRSPVPVMLFQMPGGHLRSENDVDTRSGHISTMPDYVFGDPLLKNDFSGAADIDGYLETTLQDTVYNCTVLGAGACTVGGYLTAQGQDWTQSNMNMLIRSNVFSILWGGGTGPTTSIALYPTNDNGWLAGKIESTLSSE